MDSPSSQSLYETNYSIQTSRRKYKGEKSQTLPALCFTLPARKKEIL